SVPESPEYIEIVSLYDSVCYYLIIYEIATIVGPHASSGFVSMNCSMPALERNPVKSDTSGLTACDAFPPLTNV
ncbi:MAG: hypothetical protein OXH11_18980, partial [Candidatus Aminicenantes bacterium]|nr:hypothetical protein [Candidatus Aminicenantes bacterium]